MRLTMSTVFNGSSSWQPLYALNGGCRVSHTLDAPEAVVKKNDAFDQPNQSSKFELSAAVLLWEALTLDSQLQERYLVRWQQEMH